MEVDVHALQIPLCNKYCILLLESPSSVSDSSLGYLASAGCQDSGCGCDTTSKEFRNHDFVIFLLHPLHLLASKHPGISYKTRSTPSGNSSLD